MKNLATQLIEAIENGKIVMFSYNGFPRIVKPFIVGISTKGNLLLSGYQIGGRASNGIITGWKYFDADKIVNLTIFSRVNKTIPSGYNRNDKQFSSVLSQR